MTRSLLIAALFLLAITPSAGALSLPSSPPSSSTPPAAAGQASLVFTLHNRDDQPLSVKLSIQETGETRDTDAPIGWSNVSFEVAPGAYSASASVSDPTVSRFAYTATQRANLRNCPRFGVAFELRLGSVAISPDDTGCLQAPPAFDELVTEARTVEGGRGSVRIPAPGAGDAARFARWFEVEDPDWALAENVTLTWADGVAFPDALGGTTWGAQAQVTSEWPMEAGSRVSIGDIPMSRQMSQVENVTEFVRFQAGTNDPVAFSLTSPGAGAGVTQTSASIVRAIYYWAPAHGFSCLLRSAVQQHEVHAGDILSSSDVCDDWSRGASWRAGTPQERAGLRALPLYAFRESPEGLVVARVWLADGVAYPLEVEAFSVLHDRPVERDDVHLLAYQPAGAPLRPGPAPSAPAPALSAVDPLRGPTLDAARARFVFPLDEAVDAALADPTLARLHAIVLGEGALAGASLRATHDPTSATTTLEWSLLFTSRASAPVGIVCQRPSSAVGAVPLARCTESNAPAAIPTFAEPPRFGAPDVPTMGVSFDGAVARWGLVDPASAGDAVTSAMWRAWSPIVQVGRGYDTGLVPVGTQSSQASIVALDVLRGTTMMSSSGVEQTVGVVPLPQGIAPRADLIQKGVPLAATSGTIVALSVGMAVAFLVLAGILLYARLRHQSVLDSDSRQRILDLVRDEPGIHASAVLERVGKAHGVGEYHLGVLVREGFLTCIASAGFRRYFVTGRFSHAEMRALAALRDGQNEKLFRLVEANPGIHLTELAQRAGLSLAYASRTVKKLQEAGLVDRVQVGRTITLHAIER